MTHVPIFLITGFLEGGKTTFIKEIFKDPEFAQDEKVTLIVCENGIEECENDILKENNVTLVHINSKEDFTDSFFRDCNKEYKPTKVIIEYNGMWEYDIAANVEFPKGWEIAQVITPIDASTFEGYMGNMKSLMIEQFDDSDLIIFNRCNENTDKLKFRNSVKAVNTKANMLFELENGDIDDSPLELPFNINVDVIEFEDYDFGIWYIDVTESPEKYEGKSIKLKGIVATNPKYPKNIFALGRNAMTCCEDDIAFLGILCQTEKPISFEGKEWIEIEAVIHKKFISQEEREIPFLHVENYKIIDEIEEELIYF